MTIASVDVDRVAAEARRVLAANRQRGISAWEGKKYDFVCPSSATYPFQWFWDSAFHAVALLHVDPELSKQEIRCLLQGAQADGFIPHMILWEEDAHDAARAEYSITLAHRFYTATIQPPVVARAVERIVDATGDLSFAREILPPVMRFFRWLRAYRDPDDDSLIAIIQPDESGLDASPKYDEAMGVVSDPPSETLPSLRRAMRRLFDAYAPVRADPGRLAALDVFLWEDVMVNAIYADGLRALGRLCGLAGFPPTEAREFADRSARVTRALLEKCWDERVGAFWDLHGWDERPAKTLTFTSLFPLVLEDLDRDVSARLVRQHLTNEREFWLPYPVPSVAAIESSFDPRWLTRTTWRGPSWVNVNWYLYWGLRRHGFDDVAAELARRTVGMVATGGIREFFDPYTGAGQGAPDFSWTCVVLDLIAAERDAGRLG